MQRLSLFNQNDETEKLQKLLNKGFHDFNEALKHLEAGANPDLQDPDGNTLLHMLVALLKPIKPIKPTKES